ncbi:MAG: hypothetical protein IPG34_12750 [Rhodocyclaceae bacterium]|nr:hypothetical protein [Rhodocyclaceae bacterium]
MEGGRIFSREHALDDLGLLVVVAKPLLAFEEFGAVGQPGVAEVGLAALALVGPEVEVFLPLVAQVLIDGLEGVQRPSLSVWSANGARW